jgi:hypothetical protein
MLGHGRDDTMTAWNKGRSYVQIEGDASDKVRNGLDEGLFAIHMYDISTHDIQQCVAAHRPIITHHRQPPTRGLLAETLMISSW